MALFNILVDIAARTADMETGISKATSILQEFSKTAEHIGEALEAIGFAELTHKAAEFVEETIALGDALNTAATKAGVASEAFTQLNYAAKLNSVSTDSLASAFVKMNVAISEAATGGKKQNEALAALGLTYKDLKALAPEDQFTIIADRINKLSNSSDKARAEVVLFGKAGADLAGLFSKGAEGILQAREEAERIGQSFSAETLKSFEEAHQSIDRMEQSFSALALTLVGKVAPALAETLDSITAIVSGDQILKLKHQINTLIAQSEDEGSLGQGGAFALRFGGINPLQSQQGALDEANRLKAQLALRTSNLVVNPNSLKISSLLDGAGPGFLPDPSNILQPIHPTIGKESIGGGTVNPVVQQYLDDTAALQEAGGKAYDEFSKTQAQLKGALDDGAISLDDFQKRMANASLKYQDAIDIEPFVVSLKKLPEVLSEADKRSLNFVDDVSQAFDNAAHSTGAFGQNLLKSLLQAFENRAIFNAIGAIGDALKDALNVGGRSGGSWIGTILGGLLGNGFGDSIGASANATATDFIDTYNSTLGPAYVGAFGGPKAAGGPLEMGKWYTAGEHGPEPIWGGGPGAFATGYGQGGGAPQVNITNSIDARGASIDLIKALPAILKKNNDGLESKIITGLSRNKYKLGST